MEHHLRSLKVLLVSNSHWGIQVVDSAVGSTAESTNIRHLVDGGGLAVTDPDLPFFCYLKAKVNAVLFKVMCIAVGKFYGPLLICTRADHPPTGVLLKLPLGDLLALCINAVIARLSRTMLFELWLCIH